MCAVCVQVVALGVELLDTVVAASLGLLLSEKNLDGSLQSRHSEVSPFRKFVTQERRYSSGAAGAKQSSVRVPNIIMKSSG
jgi:hypothetical protein